MKTFTKTLTTLFAVSLAALALSSCKKVQSPQTATVIMGEVAYSPTGSSFSRTIVETGVFVTITTTKIETSSYYVPPYGEKVTKKMGETIVSVQQVPVVDAQYKTNLPIAPGETYEVEVKCEFDVNSDGQISKGEAKESAKGVVKYKAERKFNVAYGQFIFGADLVAQPCPIEHTIEHTVIKGYVQYVEYVEYPSYMALFVETGVFVTVTTKIKTSNFIEVPDGKETIASVQQVPVMDKMYEANLPIAPGETYEVEVRCEFMAPRKIKGIKYVKEMVKYKAEKKFDVVYGQIFRADLVAQPQF